MEFPFWWIMKAPSLTDKHKIPRREIYTTLLFNLYDWCNINISWLRFTVIVYNVYCDTSTPISASLECYIICVTWCLREKKQHLDKWWVFPKNTLMFTYSYRCIRTQLIRACTPYDIMTRYIVSCGIFLSKSISVYGPVKTSCDPLLGLYSSLQLRVFGSVCFESACCKKLLHEPCSRFMNMNKHNSPQRWVPSGSCRCGLDRSRPVWSVLRWWPGYSGASGHGEPRGASEGSPDPGAADTSYPVGECNKKNKGGGGGCK